MKGIAHFITGVTAASFFPFAVKAAEQGNPAYFILGGAFGILPDTLDFKFYRYFYRHDITIEPDARELDPQAIAERLAEAVGRAAESPKGCRVKLCTIRVGADYWQQYSVKFDPAANEVMVRFGPVVNTGQAPIPGTLPKDAPVGRARLPVPIRQTYDATTTVDIFDGPSFLFEQAADGRVDVHFLPWHRSWSHSYLVGIGFGLLCWLAWGLWALAENGSASGFLNGWKALVIIAVGFAGHLIEDQLGFMGSNLFYPLTKKRTMGMHVMRSSDAFPNFLTVWLCGLLIFWNLYRFAESPGVEFSFLQLLLYGAAAPLGLFGILHFLFNRGKKKSEREIDTVREWGDPMMS